MDTRFVRLVRGLRNRIEAVLHDNGRTEILATSETGESSRIDRGRSRLENARSESLLGGFIDDHLDHAQRRRLAERALSVVREAAPTDLIADLLATDVMTEAPGRTVPPVLLAEDDVFPWELVTLEENDRLLGEWVAFARFAGEPRHQTIRASRLLTIGPLAEPGGLHEEGEPPTELNEPWHDQYFGMAKWFSDPALLDHVGASRTEVLARMGSAQSRVVHYMGHHFNDPQNPANDALNLSGGDTLNPGDLSAIADGSSGRHAAEARSIRWPWIFLNGCATNPADRAGTAAGWGSAVRAVGAGACIGTYWIINEGFSTKAAVEFYRAVAAGLSIGDALRRVRRFAKLTSEGFHTTYWAYTMFGDPTLKVDFDLADADERDTGEGSRPPR